MKCLAAEMGLQISHFKLRIEEGRPNLQFEM